MALETIIFITSISIFFLRTIIFLIGAARENRILSKHQNIDEYPFVSVLIPARNEELNIENCIGSISESSYPKDKYEIIVINDRSSDSTQEILENLKESHNNLRIIRITEPDENRNLQGKTHALQEGFDNALGSIILMTDADCIVGKDWIKSTVEAFLSTGASLVASFTLISPGAGKQFKHHPLLERYQAVEWIYMQTMARAGLGLGLPLGCYGNNLSILKSDIDEIGGYRMIPFSLTEDLALLQEVVKRKKKAVYLLEPSTSVLTQPCKSLGELIKQHHRWALGGIGLGWKAAMFVLTSVFQWIGIIAAIITAEPLWLLLILLCRILNDCILITISLIRLNKKKMIKIILPSVFYFLLMEAVVPFLLLKRRVRWKGRLFELKEINNKSNGTKEQI
jgi:cellulose synthase/poly-beta-1,6-N-acetylglucosamine synthase-like glycosyltransferase